MSKHKITVLAWALASKVGPAFRRNDKGPLFWRTRKECRDEAQNWPYHKPVRVRVTVEEVR